MWAACSFLFKSIVQYDNVDFPGDNQLVTHMFSVNISAGRQKKIDFTVPSSFCFVCHTDVRKSRRQPEAGVSDCQNLK